MSGRVVVFPDAEQHIREAQSCLTTYDGSTPSDERVQRAIAHASIAIALQTTSKARASGIGVIPDFPPDRRP